MYLMVGLSGAAQGDLGPSWILKKDLGHLQVYSHERRKDLVLSVEERAPGTSEEEKLLSQADVQKYTDAKREHLKEVGISDWKPLSVEYRDSKPWRESVVSGVFSGKESEAAPETRFIEWHLANGTKVFQVLFASKSALSSQMEEITQAIAGLKQP